jgi:hypothetical protein
MTPITPFSICNRESRKRKKGKDIGRKVFFINALVVEVHKRCKGVTGIALAHGWQGLQRIAPLISPSDPFKGAIEMQAIRRGVDAIAKTTQPHARQDNGLS